MLVCVCGDVGDFQEGEGIQIVFINRIVIINKMRTEINKYIVADSEICHGKPTFRGTRILVSDIVELVAAGWSDEKIIVQYPSLNKEMIRGGLEYAAKVIRGEHYVRFKVPA